MDEFKNWSTKPSIFLSCSFRENDKALVTFIKNILDEEFNVLTAEAEDKADVIQKILPKIRTCKGHFALFSRREKFEGKEEWNVPPDVLIETGFSFWHGLKIFGFLEEGVPPEQQGLLRLSSRSYPRFDRKSLENRRKDLQNYVKAVKEELTGEIVNLYETTSVTKEVTVYKNGYGVIRYQYTIQCERDVPEIFGIHTFGSGSSAKKGFILPHLSELASNGPGVRYDRKPFWATAIIKGNVKEECVTFEETDYSPEVIGFKLRIPGPFFASTLLTYEYAWGAPDLFPISGEDMSTGKRCQDLEYVESEFRLPEVRVANFTFVLRFERPVRFSKEPMCEFRGYGDALIEERSAEVQKSTLYDVYVCKLPVKLPYGRVRAYWVPGS